MRDNNQNKSIEDQFKELDRQREEELKEKINRATEQIHAQGRRFLEVYLDRDNNGSGWICPICGNGAHHSTSKGITYNTNDGGYYKCFSAACTGTGGKTGGFYGDAIEMIMQAENKTFMQALEKAMDLLSIPDIDGLFSSEISQNKGDRTEDNKYTPTKVITHKKREISQNRKDEILQALQARQTPISELIKKAQSNINNPRAISYNTARGISQATLEALGVGYIEFNDRPYQVIDKLTGEVTTKHEVIKDSILFPTSNTGFVTRSIVGKNFYKASTASGGVDIPIGLIKVIKEKDKRTERGYLKPVFIVEGVYDAPSVIEAGGDAIALIGKDNIDPVIVGFKEYGVKRPIILSLDNDSEAIREKSHNLLKDLRDSGLEAYEADIVPRELFNPNDFKDANDFLLQNPDGLKNQIKELSEIPYIDFDQGFNGSIKEKYLMELDNKAKEPPILTGFKTLDDPRFLNGGLRGGDLTVIGAVPAAGKTAITLQIADQIAADGHIVLYFSLEMAQNELISRSISRYTAKGLFKTLEDKKKLPKSYLEVDDKRRYKDYSQKELEHIRKATDQYFNDTGDTMRIIEGIGSITANDIEAEIKKVIDYTGKKPVVFIDYLQLMAQIPDSNGKRFSKTDKQITDENVLRLKQISRDYKTPIFAISSFNRENYNSPVNMQSFKESGAIEFTASVLLGLEPVNTLNPKDKDYQLKKKAIEAQEKANGFRPVRLKVLKNRNGQANNAIIYNFHFRHNIFFEQGEEEEYKNLSRMASGVTR